MPHPPHIELDDGRAVIRIPILHEDRSVIAIDKPAGWMLVPFSWQRTNRNLQAAISSSLAAGDFWARSRNLKFLRFIHRLDAETTGILLFAKSQGAIDTYSELFESRRVEKSYLAVVHGVPTQTEWTCSAKLGSDPRKVGRVIVEPREGKEAETRFKVLRSARQCSLIEARPVTGRTHQIRVHLLHAGHAILGDEIYGPDAGRPRRYGSDSERPFPMGLRATTLDYMDPFLRRRVHIEAPAGGFLRAFGFDVPAAGE